MISAFGVEHGISKRLTHEKNQKRDLKQRARFAERYQPGKDQQVRTKHLRQVQYRVNPVDQQKVKRLASDIKQRGQQKPVKVGINRNDPNRTYVYNGHHRINAQTKLRQRYTRADIEVNEGQLPKFVDSAGHQVWPGKKP